jgi:DNA-binding CsgD family transcriptional regulator
VEGRPQSTPDGVVRRTTLTAREHEVLQWCALGKSSWEISQILNVSESTVNFHLANVAKKLKVTGRRASCIAAITRGLIAPDAGMSNIHAYQRALPRIEE